jgi:hypothetical protein
MNTNAVMRYSMEQTPYLEAQSGSAVQNNVPRAGLWTHLEPHGLVHILTLSLED